MTIAIFSRFSPQILSVLKSCHNKDIETVFIWIASPNDSKPSSLFLHNLCCFPDKLLFTDDGLLKIQSFLHCYKIKALLTINENIAKWLVSNRALFSDNCRLLLPDEMNIETVLSKTKQVIAAQNAGLPTLNTYYISKEQNSYKNIPLKYFPLCLRPSLPGSVSPSFKVQIVFNKEELDTFINKTKAIKKYIIAQPFLNLPNIVVHGSRKIDGDTIGFQGFLVDRKFEGLTLTIKPFELTEDFKRKCIKFTELMEIKGPYHFEFLYDEKTGTAWFLELNNRLGGTTAKVFSLGYDEPGYLLKSYGYDVNVLKKLKKRTAVSKLALIKYFYYTLTNKITTLDYPANENKLKRIFETLKALIFYKDDILSLNDFKGAISFYINSILQKLKY